MVLEACFKLSLTEPNTNQDLFAHAESLLGHTVIQKSTSLRSRGEISSLYQQQRLKNNGSWSLSSPKCDGHKWQESTCCKQVNNTKRRASATGLWERPFSFGVCTFIRECGQACKSLLWISERSRWLTYIHHNAECSNLSYYSPSYLGLAVTTVRSKASVQTAEGPSAWLLFLVFLLILLSSLSVWECNTL